MRRNRGSSTLLLLLSLVALLAVSAGPVLAAAAPWWNVNWLYRQRISVENNLGEDLPAGAPVRFQFNHSDLFGAGKSLGTGADVRVVYYNAGSGTWTDLDRVVEAGTHDWKTTTTEVWFDTKATIAAGGSDIDYYLYYGNPGAGAPLANRAQVFTPGSLSWDTDGQWNGGSFVSGTRALSGALELNPVAQTPLVPTSVSGEAYQWKDTTTNKGYESGSSNPPLLSDAKWQRITDTTVYQGASNPSDAQLVWRTRVTNGRGQWDWIKAKFRLPKSNPPTLSVKWQGWGDDSSYKEYLYVYNNNTASWDALGEGQFRTKATAGTLEIKFSSAVTAAKYINGSNDVWVAVGARHDNYQPNAVTPSGGQGTIWVPDSQGFPSTITVSWTLPVPRDDDNDPVKTDLWYRLPTGEEKTVAVDGGTSYAIPHPTWGTYQWKITTTETSASGNNKYTESGPYSYNTEWYDDSGGSCPFLFVWNGKAYEYVTDLGGQPLNMDFMKRGILVPKKTLPFYGPHLFPTPGLKADASGQYRIKIREGLFEMDYFDELKLWLVDVPEGYEVRSATGEDTIKVLSRAPLKLYTIRDPHKLISARTLAGQDVTDLLRENDGNPAPTSRTEFTGFVLDFGRIARPQYAKLLIDGWKWTDYRAQVDKSPFKNDNIIVEVPGKDGAWVKVREIGPPNGAPDRMVIDLANAWPTSDHRVRISQLAQARMTTVLDAVMLDDSAPVPVKVTEVPATSVMLSHPGMPLVSKPNPSRPYMVKDNVVSDLPKQWASGKFTRLGEVSPLLEKRDNKFVVIQSGDSIEATFRDAAPPPAGYKRIPVVFADVIYKANPVTVDPLPFHEMTDYPYVAPEKYPDDKEYRAYQQEWNTRVYEAPAAVPSVAPASKPETQPATSQNSLDTDYLAVTYSQYPTSGQFVTETVALPSAADQLHTISVDYVGTTPGTTSGPTAVALAVSADGSLFDSIDKGATLTLADLDSGHNRLKVKVTLTTPDVTVTPSVDSLVVNYETIKVYGSGPQISLGAAEERDTPPANPEVTVSGNGITPAVALPQQGQVPVLRFRVSVTPETTTVTGVTIQKNGTGAWNGIGKIKVWRDDAGADGLFKSTVDTLVGEAVVSGDVTKVTFTAAQEVVSTLPTWFFVTYDLTDQAEVGKTYGGSLSGISTRWNDDIAAGSLPQNSGLFTIQSVASGIPALEDSQVFIGLANDKDAGTPGVQADLTGNLPAGRWVDIEIASAGSGTPYATASAQADGAGKWLATINWRPGRNTVEVTDRLLATTTTFEVDVIDPEGVVYNAVTGSPVAGAVVNILDTNGNPVMAPVVTGADGRYSFLVPPGDYRMTVAADGYSSVPSGSSLVSVPAGNGLGTVAGSRDGAFTDIYYGAPFRVVAVPLHFDVPVDPQNFSNFGLSKYADRATATAGDLVTWRLKVTNTSSVVMNNVKVLDTPPAGFRFLSGSATVNGAAIADPEVSQGRLVFSLPSVAAYSTMWVSYRTVIAAETAPGVYTNSAVISRADSAARFSSAAQASVRVTREPFLQLATLIGRVFADVNGDGYMDDGEAGISGARIIVEDGTVVTTDASGRFHLGGVIPGAKFLKLDTASLPSGLKVTTENPVAVSAPSGEMVTVNFGVGEASLPIVTGWTDPKHGGFRFVAGEVTVTNGGTEGRLAGYVEDTLFGKISVKASVDTARVRDRERVDDEPYLTYGDKSTADTAISKTTGPLFLSARWKGNEAFFGDFRIPAPSGEGREAYGARLSLTDKSGKEAQAKQSFTAYAATVSYPAVRNTFRGTEGSLYYLSHRPVVPESDRVRVEVRDSLTQRVLATFIRERGRDYRVDYTGGRLIFSEPVPASVSSGALYGLPLNDDQPVYIVADFQYEPTGVFAPTTYGGKYETNIAKDVKGNLTFAASETDRTSLLSGGVAGKVGGHTQFAVEVGSGRTTDVESYTSDDGGVTQQAVATPAGAGSRLHAEVKTDVSAAIAQAGGFPRLTAVGSAIAKANDPPRSDLFQKIQADIGSNLGPGGEFDRMKQRGLQRQPTVLEQTSFLKDEVTAPETPHDPNWALKPGVVVAEGSLTSTTAGYAEGLDPAAADNEVLRAALSVTPTPGTVYKVESTQQTDATNVNKKVDATVKVEQGRAIFTTQVGVQESGLKSGRLTKESSIGAKYEYQVGPMLWLSLGRKLSQDAPDLNADIYGARVKSQRFESTVEVTDGAAIWGLKATLSAQPAGETRYYTSYEDDTTRGVHTDKWTFGGSTKANDRVRLYAERALESSAEGVSGTNLVGGEYQATDKLGVSAALGGGTAASGAGRQTTSLGLTYRPSDTLRATSTIETSHEDGASLKQETAAKLRADWAATPEITLVGRVLVSRSEGLGYTGANDKELAVGGAYRPIKNDRLNLIGQYTVNFSDGDESGVNDSTENRTQVLSVEGGYRIARPFSLVEKVAWKRAESGEVGNAAIVDTYLLANRLVFHLARGWDLSTEYRLVKQGDTLSSGPVLEADFALPGAEAIKLGFGYNYAGFGDTLIGDDKEGGWFLRLRGLL